MQRRTFMLLLGGTAGWPLAGRAQRKPMPVMGYIGSGTSHDVASPFVVALRQGLSETGYVEGQNLAIEYRWVEGKYDRLPAFAADLVGRNVELILAPNDVLAHAAKGATSTVPIVFVTDGEIDAAFSTLVQLHAGALIIAPDGFLLSRREQLVALASRHAVPAIYPWREAVDGGGLISYGNNRTALARELGIYAGKILKGAKPADLPVQQPTKFELVINIKTAKVLGLTVPERLLVGADEVIE